MQRGAGYEISEETFKSNKKRIMLSVYGSGKRYPNYLLFRGRTGKFTASKYSLKTLRLLELASILDHTCYLKRAI